MGYASNDLFLVKIGENTKQVYYEVNGKKLQVLVKENGELFCKLSGGGGIVNINPYSKAISKIDSETIEVNGNNKLYIAENVSNNAYKEICSLDINSLKTQNFYKSDAVTSITEKINDFQIQDGKVVVNTQQIPRQQTNDQLHNSTNSISSSELNGNKEVIINEQLGGDLTKKLTNKLIKQMKKEVEELRKQHKQQQKAKQKTGVYTQIQEEETTEVEQAGENEVMKVLKQIYNTNYKDSQRGMGNHIFYNDGESIENNKYVFEITNEDGNTKKIYFNKKSKMKELENLMGACKHLDGLGMFAVVNI